MLIFKYILKRKQNQWGINVLNNFQMPEKFSEDTSESTQQGQTHLQQKITLTFTAAASGGRWVRSQLQVSSLQISGTTRV